ncbi:pantothenate kinase 2-like [Pyrus ussuriensis x Pyrus communis]|uniref:Pantothenate kinase 2-like n=1 Tax=Pyrus ussuriensis x Pyrus communis TaxID=2448454 RepID=A0A5N5FYU0_9ROSA|nr:pantothenate kinase 2-like [Pyrus ussuriensis x Pyrus communis]
MVESSCEHIRSTCCFHPSKAWDFSLDKADEMDCLVAGANFLLKLDGGYLFGLPVGIVADSIGSTLGAGAAFLLGRTVSAADDQIQVIEMIKLLETRGSKTF